MFLLRNVKYTTVSTSERWSMLCGNWPTAIASLKLYSQLRRQPLNSCKNPLTWEETRTFGSFDGCGDRESVRKYADIPLPSEARVVICGGGVMGAAVAYHLALSGLGAQTVILEQGRWATLVFRLWTLTEEFHEINSFLFLWSTCGGMTGHSSGLIGVFKPTFAQVRLAQQTIKLYEDLSNRGLATGWKACGSLNVARTRDRMTVFRRMKSQSTYVLHTKLIKFVWSNDYDCYFSPLQWLGHRMRSPHSATMSREMSNSRHGRSTRWSVDSQRWGGRSHSHMRHVDARISEARCAHHWKLRGNRGDARSRLCVCCQNLERLHQMWIFCELRWLLGTKYRSIVEAMRQGSTTRGWTLLFAHEADRWFGSNDAGCARSRWTDLHQRAQWTHSGRRLRVKSETSVQGLCYSMWVH